MISQLAFQLVQQILQLVIYVLTYHKDNVYQAQYQIVLYALIMEHLVPSVVIINMYLLIFYHVYQVAMVNRVIFFLI